MYQRIQIIINPAAGQDRPILGILNTALSAANVDWQVSITHKAGDGHRFAQQAVKDGVDAVAVYGGDGTVMEVASGLIGSNVPLAIFPGGTANVMSAELGIPGDLSEASALVCGADAIVREDDMGRIGEHYFILRAGIGLEAQMVESADRDLKDRIGALAYTLSALQALRDPLVSHYRLTLDGQVVESEGITCMIANSGNLGRVGLAVASTISVSDGLLDVVVLRRGDLGALLAVAASVVTGSESPEPLQHWQARSIRIEAEPPQSVQVDGEMIGKTPVEAEVIPNAVKIIIPKVATTVAT